jgi:hypothetical protein
MWADCRSREKDLSLMGNLFEGLHDRTTNAFNELRPYLESDYVALVAD